MPLGDPGSGAVAPPNSGKCKPHATAIPTPALAMSRLQSLFRESKSNPLLRSTRPGLPFRAQTPGNSRLFDAVVEAIRRCGPVTVLPEKTRIAFQTRMSFAQVTPRTRWLDGHVVLARRLEHPRFRKIDTISPRNHVHHFRLATLAEVNAEFENFVREAYAVGEQSHLESQPLKHGSSLNVD